MHMACVVCVSCMHACVVCVSHSMQAENTSLVSFRSRSNLGSIPEVPCSQVELHLLQQASLALAEDKQTDTKTDCS